MATDGATRVTASKPQEPKATPVAPSTFGLTSWHANEKINPSKLLSRASGQRRTRRCPPGRREESPAWCVAAGMRLRLTGPGPVKTASRGVGHAGIVVELCAPLNCWTWRSEPKAPMPWAGGAGTGRGEGGSSRGNRATVRAVGTATKGETVCLGGFLGGVKAMSHARNP
jgi:hypothetical protein